MYLKEFFEFIYDRLNLALDTLDYLYFVATIGLSILIYSKTHGILLAIIFFISISILAIWLLENSVFLLASLFLSLLAVSLYYTHTLWIFSIVYALFCYAYWYYFGKDPELGSVKIEYSLSEELDPLTASFIFKESIDTFDIVASIYNLIRKGEIDVEIQKNDIYLKKKSVDSLLSKPEMFLLDRVFIMTGVEIAAMGINLKKDEFPEVVSFGHVLENILKWEPAFLRVVEEHVVDSGYYDYAPVLQRKYTKYLSGILFMAFVAITSYSLRFSSIIGYSKVLFNIVIPGIIPPVTTYILSLCDKENRKRHGYIQEGFRL